MSSYKQPEVEHITNSEWVRDFHKALAFPCEELRAIFVTPYLGDYGYAAGVVVTVEGSPPRETLVVPNGRYYDIMRGLPAKSRLIKAHTARHTSVRNLLMRINAMHLNGGEITNHPLRISGCHPTSR